MVQKNGHNLNGIRVIGLNNKEGEKGAEFHAQKQTKEDKGNL